MSMEKKLSELKDKLNRLRAAGGPEKVAQQHAKGKLTARERIERLVDAGTFVETGGLTAHRAVHFGMEKREIPGDGVVTGYAAIDGRLVCLYSQDFTLMGGSLGEAHAQKISRVQDHALKVGAPIIALNDSGGARIQEGIDALKGYGEIFRRNTIASGVVPQVTAIMGPCAGGAVYSPAIGDFVIMTAESSSMFITGPDVVHSVTGERVTVEGLGGPAVHHSKSGVAHLVGATDEAVIDIVRRLLAYLPSNNMEEPASVPCTDYALRETPELYAIIPEDTAKGYQVRSVVTAVLDEHEFLEIHAGFAPNVIVGFGRLDGRSVGVVANNPNHLAGVLDIDSSDKASRFVRFCDAFNIPILTFVDTPGYLPGLEQEYGGIIRHGAKLLYAYSEATVPLVTVILRKAYGGAYVAMASRHLGADVVLALPTAEIAVMGPEAASRIVFRHDISSADDPAAKSKALVEQYGNTFVTPYPAASRGYIDDVIDPKQLRTALINSFRAYQNKSEKLPGKKHGVMPV